MASGMVDVAGAPAAGDAQAAPGRFRPLFWAVLVILLALGLGLRLIDLTDAPLDYQPMRQLRGAIIARGMYYQMTPSADPAVRARAVRLAGEPEAQEPPILERLVAIGYLIAGAEKPWIARLFNAAFWMIGAAFLYLLARRMTSRVGALVAIAYYLILPFGVDVSRSFQPDALMIMALIITAYALYSWSERATWGWAIVAGIAAGATVLIKGRIALMLLVVALSVVLTARGLRRAIRDPQSWAIGLIMVAIPAAYYLVVIGPSTLGYMANTSGNFLWMTLTPSFYMRWMIFLDGLVYLGVAFLALIGALLLKKNARALALGLWAGFGVYGISLPYTMYTHDYYNLPIVPVIALSLAPLADLLVTRLRQERWHWRALALAVAAVAIAYPAWITRSALLSKNYRLEPLGWQKMGRELPKDGSIIALTHDYGYRLAYYGWTEVKIWPGLADLQSYALQGIVGDTDFEQAFRDRTRGMHYFLVTLFSDLNGQPQLKAKLYDHYTIAAQGDGYVLFDLTKPK